MTLGDLHHYARKFFGHLPLPHACLCVLVALNGRDIKGRPLNVRLLPH